MMSVPIEYTNAVISLTESMGRMLVMYAIHISFIRNINCYIAFHISNSADHIVTPTDLILYTFYLVLYRK